MNTQQADHACRHCGKPCECGQAADCNYCLTCWGDPRFRRDIVSTLTNVRDGLRDAKDRLTKWRPQ